MRRFALRLAVFVSLTLAGLATVWAQAYPSKPVRIIVAYPPGSGSDITTRLVTPALGSALRQQIVVDNRAGAAGTIGAEIAARAAPDGYTLLMAPGSLTVTHTLNKKLTYDLVKDFDAVTMVAFAPYVLVVHPSLPVRTVKDLIALAKARPAQLNYASGGSGTIAHLTAEVLKLETGIDMVHVPYKSGALAVTDVLNGQVSILFGVAQVVQPFIKSGRLRALAVTSAARSSREPGLPTVAEAGLPGFESGTWYALVAPAGTPREIIGRLNTEVSRIVQSPEVRERLAVLGAEPRSGTPQQVVAHIRSEIAKWAKAIQASGTRID